jgi:pyruvate,water dikinase
MQALVYRRMRGETPMDAAVSVGVQEMIPGRRSFVVFTCNPQSGTRDTVVAAGLGIGEGVVKEKVPVDHYFLDRGTGEVTATTVDKTERMEEDPSGEGLDPVLVPVDGESAVRPALSEEEVRSIAALGDRAEALFGCPQDVEGTITADGTVYLLQSRPIVFDRKRQRLWSNANITESFPGVTTALTYSFAQQFYLEDFRGLYHLLGVPAKEIEQHESDLRNMIGLLNGRVYYALDSWYRLHRMSPLFPAWRPSWQRMMGMSPSVHDAQPDIFGRGPGDLLACAQAILRLASLRVRHARLADRFGQWWGTTIRRHREAAAGADTFELVRLMRSLWAQVRAGWGLTLMNDFFLQTTTDVSSALFARWLPLADTGLHSDLLCGDEENTSVAILMSTLDLAEQARGNRVFLKDLADEPPGEVWSRLERGAYGAEFLGQVREHLHAYGDRGLQELKLEVPGPRQQPAQLLAIIGKYAAAGVTSGELREREREIRRQAEIRLDRLLTGKPVRRRVLRGLLESQRRYVAFRENSRYARSELYSFAKDVFGRLSEELVARGDLDAVDDIFHLQQDEILGFFDGTGVTADLKGLARVRRAEYEQHAAELPMNFATHGAVRDSLPVLTTPGSGELTLRGLGSSGGVVRGTARVVLDPHQPVDLDADSILIARETDPGWIFLMLAVKGIVVERGTMLSHTAITGRKFGIPTVVAVPHATSRISDGASIEINGATGTVRLLEEGDA